MTIWTDEAVALLKEMRFQGYSASQIAVHIPGATRNSVIGKMHRLGIGPEIDPVVMAARAQRSKQLAEERMRRAAAALRNKRRSVSNVVRMADYAPTQVFCKEAEAPLLIRLFDLRFNHCRFVIGEPAEGLFCGHDKQHGSSFCPAHHHLVYEPRRPRLQAAE